MSALHASRIGERLFGAVADGQTYKNLLYLLVSIPLGIVYWMGLGFGLVFGLVLAVVLVGLVILLATLFGIRAIAGFERRLANMLLDLELRPYDDVAASDEGGVLASVRPYVDAPSTWRAVGFVSLKTLVSIVALLGAILFASVVSLVSAPLRFPATLEGGEVNGEPVTWTVETLPEAALAAVLGAVLLVVFVHLANAVAYVCGRMAAALLGEPASSTERRRSNPPFGRPSSCLVPSRFRSALRGDFEASRAVGDSLSGSPRWRYRSRPNGGRPLRE